MPYLLQFYEMIRIEKFAPRRAGVPLNLTGTLAQRYTEERETKLVTR